MNQDSLALLRLVKRSAIVVFGLMMAGILTLMVLARGKGEDGDIAGIVAPAALITVASAVAAVVAGVRQKRAERSALHR